MLEKITNAGPKKHRWNWRKSEGRKLGLVMLPGSVFYIFNTSQERLYIPYAYRVMLLGEDKSKVQVNQKFCRISGKVLPEIIQNLKVYLCLIIVMEGRQPVHLMQSCGIWPLLCTLIHQHHIIHRTYSHDRNLKK